MGRSILNPNPIHLKKLSEVASDKQEEVGIKVKDFLLTLADQSEVKARKVFMSYDQIENKKYNRNEIFNFVENKNNDSLTCAFLIFAWGGQKPPHALTTLKSSKIIVKTLDAIRENKIDRDSAYKWFFENQNNGLIKGLGPAFYTKLLYFFGRSKEHDKWDAYIMDQWTALSINLLYEDQLIKMNKVLNLSNGTRNFYVNKKNTWDVYAKFNDRLKNLAEKLSDKKIIKTPEDAEIMIFSHGGKKKGAWRQYLIDVTQ